MKNSRLILFALSVFIFASCSKEDVWYSGVKDKPRATVTFAGNAIYTKIAGGELEDMDGTYLETEYDLVEKIVSEEDSKAKLYVLQEMNNGKFSVLPEYETDANNRRFDIETSQVQANSKEELMKNLNKEIDTFQDGPSKLPMKYVYFGNVKMNGEKFSKK